MDRPLTAGRRSNNDRRSRSRSRERHYNNRRGDVRHSGGGGGGGGGRGRDRRRTNDNNAHYDHGSRTSRMSREEDACHYGPPRGNHDEQRWEDTGSSNQQPRNNRNRGDSFDGMRRKNDDDGHRHRHHREDSFGERGDNMDRHHPLRGGDGGGQHYRPLSHSQHQQSQSQHRQSTTRSSSDAPSHLPVQQHCYHINPHAKLDAKLATLSEPTPQNEDPRGDDPMKRITNKAQKRGNGMNTESFDPASTLVRPDLRVWVGSKDTKEFDKTLKHDDGMLLILISFVKYVAFRVRSI